MYLSTSIPPSYLKVLTCYTMPRPEGFNLCNPAGGNIQTPSSLIALSNGSPSYIFRLFPNPPLLLYALIVPTPSKFVHPRPPSFLRLYRSPYHVYLSAIPFPLSFCLSLQIAFVSPHPQKSPFASSIACVPLHLSTLAFMCNALGPLPSALQLSRPSDIKLHICLYHRSQHPFAK